MKPVFSLRRTIVITGLASLICACSALIFVSIDFLSNAGREHSYAALERIALEKAEIIKREIGAILITARLLARSLEHIQKNGAPDPRRSAAGFVKNLVRNNPFIGMAAAWEANAFDGADEEHVGQPFSGARGRFAIYYFRANDDIQELLLDMRPLEKGGLRFGWYDVPVQENREFLMPPYLNPVEGADVWMTTAAIPIPLCANVTETPTSL